MVKVLCRPDRKNRIIVTLAMLHSEQRVSSATGVLQRGLTFSPNLVVFALKA